MCRPRNKNQTIKQYLFLFLYIIAIIGCYNVSIITAQLSLIPSKHNNVVLTSIQRRFNALNKYANN